MGEGIPTIDTDFAIGVQADGDLEQGLSDIITNAKNFSDAMDNLISYFNQTELWKGEDAEALRAAATAEDGPLNKLKKYQDELNKLSALAESLKGAIGQASAGLKANVNTAMGVGGDGGNA